MLGKRFSFKLQKRLFLLKLLIYSEMTKRNFFYKIIATTTKKVEIY